MMSGTQPIERGQRWRRKRDGVTVVITGYFPDVGDGSCRREDNGREWAIYGHNLRAKYDLLAEAAR